MSRIALREFGHHVRLATHANFCSFVRSAGVDFYPLGGDPLEFAGSEDMNISLCLFVIIFISAVQLVDVWSCGVTLSVMLVGAYPFEDPKNFRKTQCITISQNYGSSIQDPQLCPHNSGLIAVISSLAYLLQIQSKKGKLPLKDADGQQKMSLTPEAKYNFCPSAWVFCVYLMVYIDSWN
ncbi:hypothetical protein DKX38_010042 [Salix brachista]|uniref:Protein kinase domain-containing protein n=1 Tax=Salix brachista TaxID=2182728 RepID=A0A5N5MET7_9ROSI|nr:hypothetical protein DKX38_010042 [Salix brachista]